jgi:DNA-binding response OmpR family regulator
MRVLVVEDSEKLRRALGLALRKAGYVADLTGDGEEGLWFGQNNDYDAILLDLLLPTLDGWEILRRLRAAGRQAPVLILTVKGTLEDRVGGLRAGADDYLTKPFAMEELLARVEALVRRKYGARQPVLEVGDLRLDTLKRQATRAGQVIGLAPREYRLLEFLAHRTGEVVSRTDIEAHLYNEETDVFSNVVESTISTLRKKLEPPGCTPLIHTRRGMGYVLAAET